MLTRPSRTHLAILGVHNSRPVRLCGNILEQGCLPLSECTHKPSGNTCVCMCHDICVIPVALGARVNSECQRQTVGGKEQHGMKGLAGSSQPERP